MSLYCAIKILMVGVMFAAFLCSIRVKTRHNIQINKDMLQLFHQQWITLSYCWHRFKIYSVAAVRIREFESTSDCRRTFFSRMIFCIIYSRFMHTFTSDIILRIVHLFPYFSQLYNDTIGCLIFRTEKKRLKKIQNLWFTYLAFYPAYRM